MYVTTLFFIVYETRIIKSIAAIPSPGYFFLLKFIYKKEITKE